MRLPLSRLLAVGRDPEHAVCREGERLHRWSEFGAAVATAADRLGAEAGERCLVADQSAWHFAVALFAAWQAGKIAVVPANFQPDVLAQTIAQIQAANARDAERRTTDCAVSEELDASRLCLELYTSGSTGEPKCVGKSLAQLDAEVAALEALWGATAGSATVVATVPHHHIYGMLFRLLWPLSAGRPFDAEVCADPDRLLLRLRACEAAILVSSPAHLSRLPELIALDKLQPRPRLVFSSGGALPAQAALSFLEQIGAAPLEVFGSTETGGVAWRVRADDGDTSWTALPGVVTSVDADGALVLHSPFLPQRKAWRMDDAAELLADGRFMLRGRLDRIVKIEEKRLALPDLEQHLRQHPWVADCVAVALSGRRATLGVVAVLRGDGATVLARDGRRTLGAALRHHLSTRFEAVLLPRRWRFVEDLPYDERGKLPAQALAAMFASAPTMVGRYAPEIVGAEITSATQVELTLVVPEDLSYFAGHFADLPILPGVVQVDWAARLATRYFSLPPRFAALEKLKFQAVVRPGARMRLELRWHEAHARLDFAYVGGERVLSTGCFLYAKDSATL